MDRMSRNDPTDQSMTDTSGMRSLDDMEGMRNSEDLLDTEGGIPGMTGPGTQASMGSQGAQGSQWSGSQSASQGQSQGQGQRMSIDPDSPDQQALNPDVEVLNENDPNVARDPVCGRLVDKRTAQNTLASPVNEQMGTVYFHSPECKTIFEADPQRFGSNF